MVNRLVAAVANLPETEAAKVAHNDPILQKETSTKEAKKELEEPHTDQLNLQTEEEAERKESKREQFLDDLYDVQFHAGMNQRYHQQRSSSWARLDALFKIVTGVLATAGCVATFAADVPILASQIIAGVAAFFAVLLNVIPFGQWSKDHIDFCRRWSDLLEDSEVLSKNVPDSITGPMYQRVKDLTAKMHRINATEPAPNVKKLKQCEDAERKARGETKD